MIRPLLAIALLAAGTLPFPAPKLIPVTDALRSDAGVIRALDLNAMEMKMGASAGEIIFKISTAQVAGPDGRALGGPATLHTGQSVRVYYLVDGGAIAKEIDVQR
jgi:hypothetical protein